MTAHSELYALIDRLPPAYREQSKARLVAASDEVLERLSVLQADGAFDLRLKQHGLVAYVEAGAAEMALTLSLCRALGGNEYAGDAVTLRDDQRRPAIVIPFAGHRFRLTITRED